MKLSFPRAWLTFALLVGAFSGQSRAQLTAISFNTIEFGVGSGGNGVFGWRFTALSNMNVVDVGIFDFPTTQGLGDGLIAAHAIGIWDMAGSGSLLSSSVVPTGTGAAYVGGFRYVPVASPSHLLEGHQYVIGARFDSDDASVSDFNPAPGLVVTVSPDLSFGGYSFTNQPGLTMPDHHDFGHFAMFGPNFTYTLAAVPEPATLPFVLAGALGFFAYRIISRRRAQARSC